MSRRGGGSGGAGAGGRGRGRGRGGGGGRGGGYDGISRESQPPAPSYGRGRGREGGGQRGRGGYTYTYAPRPQHVPAAPIPTAPIPHVVPGPVMAALAAPPAPTPAPQSSLSQQTERLEQLSIAEKKPEVGMTSGAVTAASSSSTALTDAPPRSSKSISHPARPGFGRAGRPCIVRANHFLVEVADRDLCHYDVVIVPETTSRKLNRAIMAELVKLHRSSYLGGRLPVYDGSKSLYTAGSLPFSSREFVVRLEQADRPANRREREFRVTIKFAAKADLHHLQAFLQNRQFDCPQETVQALDVVLRESPCTEYTSVGRSFFTFNFGHGDLEGGVEYWRGYYQSLRPTQMGLSLNIDVAATSFYKGAHLIDFVLEFLNLREAPRTLGDHDKMLLKKVLRGVRVETTHNPELRIRYKINGISPAPIDSIMFSNEEGTSLSVVQYFWEKYGYDLHFPKWPCLLAGSDGRPKYIPIEVCQIVPGQRYVKKLSDRQVTSMLRATCKRPQEREANILQVVNANNYNSDNFANEFGMKVNNKMVSVEARVLPPPLLKYHDSGKEKSCQPTVGQWNMINMKMVNGGRVENWTCLNLSRTSGGEVANFCEQLVDMCNHKGMVFNTRPCIQFIGANPRYLDVELRKLHKNALSKSSNGRLDLLIIILPDKSGSYGLIKKVCETELGIVSQCCQPRHVARCNKQYLENLTLKINVKVGGRNTVLNDAVSKTVKIQNLTDRPTIIFGADVTHPAPGEDSSPSIAAVVASMDWPEVTKYRGVVSAQTHRKEIIENLFSTEDSPKGPNSPGGMVRELLVAFYRSTGRKPDRIIFYRDGVSEGQFSQVLLHEMDKIRMACASLQADYQPRVTFIVVQKRHHTRLFPEDHRARNLTDRSGNILPGTVVDRKICHPTEFDFYLCSHAGIQGTSRPTHYHVLYDENNFSADGLQTLTNNLCYTYARCTRSVSIVPPAYYAHLAAFRARYYMEAEQSETSSSGRNRSGETSVTIRMLPTIKENVKEVMFYC